MEKLAPNGGFLASRQARILSLFLIVQAVLFYSISHGENIPAKRPLSELPHRVASWQMVQEGVVEKEVQDVLRADEVLTRSYASPGTPVAANLFVAFFKSQRTGVAPHSPKNCMPGAGWVPTRSDTVRVAIAGRPDIEVNRYIVQKGGSKSVVLYWYQSRDRVVASEYTAKFYVVADAIRYNRTDTALVRVTVPVMEDAAAAEQIAIRFVQDVFQPLRQYLPA
ncbi:MAG: EpsI family protein [Acidobacteria bacterium]|nr:EpsI family protein [Acidobacteriota bacterium]MBI3280818.1 EpsI family protein [Acidobacteriota bacterium]